jgi:membrane-associated phospholipid phosphatase
VTLSKAPDKVGATAAAPAKHAPAFMSLPQNVLRNFAQWGATLVRAPRTPLPPVSANAIAAVVGMLAATVAAMFMIDTAASAWARTLPRWFIDAFEQITNFGLSGWFLFPSGFVLLCLAAVLSPALPWLTQGVIETLAARFGFLFLAVGAPGLFVTIVKRLIGRARPYVGNHDDPFAYMPFIWRSEYASMPSGHATTAASAAIAIGALWPRSRPFMWLYAFTIMFSRVVVLAHHPSDVIAGALVGGLGALAARRWFAARRLVFRGRDLRALPGSTLARIGTAALKVFRGA